MLYSYKKSKFGLPIVLELPFYEGTETDQRCKTTFGLHYQ